jgi:hypothetical protein
MKTIWKYVLKSGTNSLEIPLDFNVLSVNQELDKIILYCLIDPLNLKKEVRFDVVGTGRKLNDSFIEKKFIGSVSNNGENHTFHVFQVV